ncbi:hypothetical protein [Candidatus Phytoplasma prunorum]|uniref:hypothetical protein n=1 Tax=Candidatus Phytoplasma prunorum TaxID=47565 RepID=UPI002FEE8C74
MKKNFNFPKLIIKKLFYWGLIFFLLINVSVLAYYYYHYQTCKTKWFTIKSPQYKPTFTLRHADAVEDGYNPSIHNIITLIENNRLKNCWIHEEVSELTDSANTIIRTDNIVTTPQGNLLFAKDRRYSTYEFIQKIKGYMPESGTIEIDTNLFAWHAERQRFINDKIFKFLPQDLRFLLGPNNSIWDSVKEYPRIYFKSKTSWFSGDKSYILFVNDFGFNYHYIQFEHDIYDSNAVNYTIDENTKTPFWEHLLTDKVVKNFDIVKFYTEKEQTFSVETLISIQDLFNQYGVQVPLPESSKARILTWEHKKTGKIIHQETTVYGQPTTAVIKDFFINDEQTYACFYNDIKHTKKILEIYFNVSNPLISPINKVFMDPEFDE